MTPRTKRDALFCQLRIDGYSVEESNRMCDLFYTHYDRIMKVEPVTDILMEINILRKGTIVDDRY